VEKTKEPQVVGELVDTRTRISATAGRISPRHLRRAAPSRRLDALTRIICRISRLA
jgi:hypothetical protein